MDARKIRENSIGWAIQRLARRLNMAMDARLSALDLTINQFKVMMIVLESEGLSQVEIGKKFEMPAYAITRTLDSLEEQGHVERREHPSSRRTHQIFSTARGKELAADLFEVVGAVNAEFTGPLSGEEKIVFSGMLMRLLGSEAHAQSEPAQSDPAQSEPAQTI